MTGSEPPPLPAPRPSLVKPLAICAAIGCGGWLALNAGAGGYTLPLPDKREVPPLAGVIGREDRVPLAEFTPDDPDAFPGWEEAVAAVVRISCDGSAAGGGVLIGEGDRMLSAAHVFLEDNGSPRPRNAGCVAVSTTGDRVRMDVTRLKAGPFRVPEALSNHLSVGITRTDWVVVRLEHVPEGARPLPIATAEQITLDEHYPVLNVSGATDNFATDGFIAQTCGYRGVPPSASALDAAGEIYGRLAQEGDEWLVARYDCDAGAGSSGSPIIGWHEGAPYVWGIVTDSLRGDERCPDVGYNFCYTAGPLVTAMDIVP